MILEPRPASTRGQADHGWLKSAHTFSFGGWHDPRYMGFGHLRVINEDRVAAGKGFPTHPHRNMEILSYVISGGLAHRDTLGTGSVIRPGEVQRMTAGAGIAHSEMNASKTDPVHFLQIWILPAQGNTAPGYEQKAFPVEPGLRLVVSPDGRDGSLRMGQDTDLWRLLLPAGEAATHTLRRKRAWIQVIKGGLRLGSHTMTAGDGVGITEATALPLSATADAEALIFDLL